MSELVLLLVMGIIVGLLIGILRRLEDIYQLMYLWYEADCRRREYESRD